MYAADDGIVSTISAKAFKYGNLVLFFTQKLLVDDV
jgi:hypothetical protein